MFVEAAESAGQAWQPLQEGFDEPNAHDPHAILSTFNNALASKTFPAKVAEPGVSNLTKRAAT